MTILDKLVGQLCDEDAVMEANEELAALRSDRAKLGELRRLVIEVVKYDWESLAKARDVCRIGPWKYLVSALATESEGADR